MAIPSGEIYLLKNVPLSFSYDHTIDFKDKSEQFTYFNSFLKYKMENYTYMRREREYISLELPITSLEDVNYLVFRSQEGERLYYAFVTNAVYVSPTNTQLFYMVDVMQTYQFDYTWKASYIKQSHVDRWNAEHKPIYSKTDEGLDYGTEYSVESAYRLQQSDVVKWLVVSTSDFSEMEGEGYNGKGGNLGYAPTPFGTFFVPVPIKSDSGVGPYKVFINDVTAAAGQYSGLWSGYIANYRDLISLLLNSAFGNYVKSIAVLPYNPFLENENVIDNGDGTHTVQYNTNAWCEFAPRTFPGVTYPFYALVSVNYDYFIGTQPLARADWNTGLEASLPTAEQWEEIKEKPYTTKRDKRFETKLLCAPYRYNLLTDWRNNPVIFKNEYMTEDKIEIDCAFGLSYNLPFRYWMRDYKKDPEGRYTSLLQPMAMEMPIISDQYYTYMLENKNTIQANITNAAISAGAGILSGAVSGVAGGPAGVLMGAASGIANGVMNVSAMLRSENAKQADLKAKPDTIVNSNDSSFNITDNNTDITFYRMRICCENEEIISEILNMTGYKVNRVDVPNTRSRTRFNYLQTVGANIVGSFNQADLARIKEIYDRGITIWHYHKDHFNPLDYSFENIEVNLI